MKKQGTRNRAQGTEKPEIAAEIAVDTTLQVQPKAKARKTKVVEPVEEISPEVTVPVEAAPAKAKSAKKAAKKASPAKAEEALPAEAAPEPSGLDKPKKERKKPKKEKGRDLVVDEPGADEVAAVLHTPDEAKLPAEEPELKSESKPEPKLERLQKILAKAGISSRRKAEELILGGRVQINGKVVMELGTKADPVGDHVRVDGKLLQGPERIRYFVLNKPKGFVTTVSDPEGRPTVMQFFAGEHERLYPVGRLDYLSEGLLLVTNDGELANKLTKAASGVEKTYLVKVAGQPTEDMLDVLRAGVVIEKGRPGTFSGRVRTAPAQIRQVRQGDNPWYEVIIIEGRNRELRKMFEEIGHHVEKIRRVGYGPLVLDLEPGKLRELEAEEVHKLRLASEGKLKTKRKGSSAAGQLPTVAGKTVRYKKADGKPGYQPRARVETKPEARPDIRSDARPDGRSEFKPVPRKAIRPEFQQESKRDFNPAFRPESKTGFKKEFKPDARPGTRPGTRPDARPGSKPAFRPEFKREGKPEFKPAGRPNFKSAPGSGFGAGFKSGGRPAFGSKPRREEPPVTDYVLPPRKSGAPEDDFDAKSGHQGSGFNPDYKPGFRTGAKPAFRSDRPGGKPAFRADGPPKSADSRSGSQRAGGTQPLGRYNAADDDFVPKKTPGFRVEPVEDRPRNEARTDRPRSGGFGRTGEGGKTFRPAGARPASGDRAFGPRSDRPETGRPGSGRAGSGRPSGPGSRPDARPASGSRPFRPSTRPDSVGTSERPARFTPRSDSAPGGPPARRVSSAGEDRPREFRPRPTRTDGPPKKFAASKPGRPSTGKTGQDGEPRKKERWRNSFTGKNKGRPKPKS